MKKSTVKKTILVLTILIASPILFYKFMTYDRTYNWSKEFEYEVQKSLKNTDYYIERTTAIDVDSIKLPTERFIKINIQKYLSKLDLMNYGREHGKKLLIISKNSNHKLFLKGWCLSDHLIGLEVEYKNIHDKNLSLLKSDLENQFSHYKIIYTEIKEKQHITANNRDCWFS